MLASAPTAFAWFAMAELAESLLVAVAWLPSSLPPQAASKAEPNKDK
jgi:hypothetical protein